MTTVRYYPHNESNANELENRLYFRTLTPLEYWKLQGFVGDEPLSEKYRGINSLDFKFSDLEMHVGKEHLLKQAGNAVSTKVITAIGAELSTLLEE